MSKKDGSGAGLRSPRLTNSNNNSNSSRTPVPPPQLFPHYVDADSFSPREVEDRSIFQRYIAENLNLSNSSSNSNLNGPQSLSLSSPRQAMTIRSPRVPAHSDGFSSSSASTTMGLLTCIPSPRGPVAAPLSLGPSQAKNLSPLEFQREHPSDPHAPSSASPTKLRNLHLLRPHSPVGELPPESVVSLRASYSSSPLSPRTPRIPRATRRAILAASDMDKITLWLQSLENETRSFSSYFLYCEMLFRESRVLTQGKPEPNRLQTAVAFHCLCKATSVFARHEHILVRICRDLGAAIFVNHDELPIGNGEIEALECFSQLLTYYDNQNQLQQQREHMNQDILKQRAFYENRLKEEQMQLDKIKDLEHRYQLKGLDKISHRNTAEEELNDKLHVVLHNFQYIDDPGKQRVVLGVIESLRAHVTADTLFSITEQMSMYEKDKLFRQLFQDEISQITEKIRSEVFLSSSAQQNAILERSVTRITRFQSLISEMLHAKTAKELSAAASGRQQPQQNGVITQRSSRALLLDDDDICDQDRKVLEAVSDVMDELQSEKQKNTELAKKLEEAEQTLANLRFKSNALATEAQENALKHTLEMESMRQELAMLKVESEEKEVQTNRRGAHYDDEDYDDDDDEDGNGTGGGSGMGGGNGKGRASRRRFVSPNDDEDLIIKNRRTNKFGVGIASIIEQAKIPSSKIRKILSKRKPLTLNELHAIIVGYYQAKMFQDVQDDNVGKLRSNLAQFIMEMYVLHYGLKDLAISQLVFLDASIRKHAKESARVRTFGLLTGSLDPESHACSVQGIDFFLFVVVVIFNGMVVLPSSTAGCVRYLKDSRLTLKVFLFACVSIAGVYKKGRKQAVAIAQNLKTVFGDGIFMSPRATTVKGDLVCQTIDLVFSFTRNDPGGPLDQLKDEIRRGMGSSGSGSGGVEIDLVLEKLMNYWFTIYEQQIQDIHSMFALVDANGDGMLDFREFCEIVVVLEPDIDRRDALVLYNRAAGDDHVVDKDEFVQVMLAHQRGVILKEFYGGDSNKKIIMGIQQRKNTFAAPSSALPTGSNGNGSDGRAASLEYQSLAGVMAELDREESYASLAAAMSSVTANAGNNSDMDDDDDDGGIYESEREQSDRNMKESVSFMTLSRLSLWAAEAKGKLQTGSEVGTKFSSSIANSKRPLEGLRADSSLKPVAEQQESIGGGGNGGDFEQEMDELLRQALSKANIHVDDLLN